MATVYKIEIETVSPWVNRTPKDMEKLIEEFLENYEDENGMGFESTEISVRRTA